MGDSERIAMIRAWMRDPVTVEVFRELDAMLAANMAAIRAALTAGRTQDAMNLNAHCDALEEIIDAPNQMIHGAREDDDEAGTVR